MADDPARARFYYRDPGAPKPNQPRALSVIAILEWDGSVLLERRSDAVAAAPDLRGGG